MRTTTLQPQLTTDTAEHAEDDFHASCALLRDVVGIVSTEAAGFPAEISRRGQRYEKAEVAARYARIAEDLGYIGEYLRQCSKVSSWPSSRRLT